MTDSPSMPNRSPAPKILVVDDNKGVVEFLKILLSKHGFTVLCAVSGRECLDTIQAQPVDLIILDVMMPVMDGLEVCRELKRIVPSVPIILLTARDDMVTRAAAMELGVSEFVAKPVNNRDLLARVTTQIGTHQWEKRSDEAVSAIEQPPQNGRAEK